MITKLIAIALSIIAVATAIVAGLSFKTQTEVASFEHFDRPNSVGIPRDFAFAQWCDPTFLYRSYPKVQGLLILHRNLGNGARIYVHARRGALSFAHFSPRTPGSPKIQTATQFGGFGIEKASIDGIQLGCSRGWNQEVLKWIRGGYANVRSFTVPLWFLFAMLAAQPVAMFVRGPFRRWRRRCQGHCIQCNYDLTGNISGTCPECGAGLTEVSQPQV